MGDDAEPGSTTAERKGRPTPTSKIVSTKVSLDRNFTNPKPKPHNYHTEDNLMSSSQRKTDPDYSCTPNQKLPVSKVSTSLPQTLPNSESESTSQRGRNLLSQKATPAHAGPSNSFSLTHDK